MRYSLANYKVAVALPEQLAQKLNLTTIVVGGEGSYLESISISFNGTLYSTSADANGSYVHNKSLDRSGSVELTLNQLSNTVALFKTICNIYYTSDVHEGMTLTVESSDGTVAKCHDCVLSSLPSQSFGSTAATQSWSFTCGKIELM